MNGQKRLRVLVLFSGGLDSMLTAEILKAQDFDVTGLVFTGYFFDALKAIESAEKIGIKLIQKDISEEHLKIVKDPKHGHGKGMNPCIDCHELMLLEAKKVFISGQYDILATGEVLNQRPFSQNRSLFQKIEKDTKLEGKILRPLSAGVLPKTIYEENGIVQRHWLYGINNKSRKKQIKLAKKFGIKEYPTPSGGCVLAEPLYAEKVRNLLQFNKKPTRLDIQLLKIGRHFWLEKKKVLYAHIVLGKNKEENEFIVLSKRSSEIIVQRMDEKGPTALLIFKRAGKQKKEIVINEARKLIWRYSGKKPISYEELEYAER
ncbi:MAG: tRNA 4-thiouridine(8) synthase ThiI [Patescibacteria group bacterium]|nr:tRNA 4-thiouridine(8) synthase ThiI [Patescibacteria group bacterium]